MLTKKTLLISTIFALTSTWSTAQTLDSTPALSPAALLAQQAQLVQNYLEAEKSALKAHAKIAQAVRLQWRAGKLQAASKTLTGAEIKTEALKVSELEQTLASKKVQIQLKDPHLKLDESGKKQLLQALEHMAQSVARYSQLKSPVGQFQDLVANAQTARTLPDRKLLEVGQFILTSAPGNLRNLTSTLTQAVAFAKSQHMTVPAQVLAAI